ncbi:hypothetical protein [Pseudomonas xantholysinigenes]|uniref:hypothetical protein n=1 Tax=Pseudomonas xantholysinigenes TaxID=2745490 RepID=UPI001CED6C76|nr:hypothetical protein [Pseudomonas xantholysinigenes]
MQLIMRRLLQAPGLVLGAYLFICLMSAGIRDADFSLALPELVDPNSNSTVELVLLTVPGLLLFLLIGALAKKRRNIIATFVLIGMLNAWLQCLLFAECFGSTWSGTEILLLLGVNTPWLMLALLPGLSMLVATERWFEQGA